MDEEMYDSDVEESFEASETDLDYEFDTARYFDFTRPESISEAQEAELWFEYAGSYPPSPFIIKLKLRDDIPVQNTNPSPKSKDGENMNSVSNDLDVGTGPEISALDENNRGLKFHNHMVQDVPKAKARPLVKSSISSSSTLMKPTASQLAKQNRPREACSGRFLGRFPKPLIKINERSSRNPSGVENQATKRQKLEIGYLRKVAHLKHQTLLTHKVPEKVGPVVVNSVHARLKVTIPREPDLETAHRAQRQRSKNNAESGERAKSNVHTFRARPLNRKILEAPSLPLPRKSTPHLPEFQVFHLKTLERAIQHSCDYVVNRPISSSISQNRFMDSKRPNSVDALRQEKCDKVHKFKAHPLSKKIFSTKGDMGVFRNIKREATVPMEFKFPTDESFPHNPPIELFSKLSLNSELQPNVMSQPKLRPTKESKENEPGSFQQEHGMLNVVKEKLQEIGEKQNQFGSDRRIPEIGLRPNINR